MTLRRLAVYCGSADGADPVYADAAREFAQVMAGAGLDLVYGGGRLGLMGVMADTVLAAGGKVYGVIPQVLPLWISYALYRFESNVRSATVVGMVGAGGIGVTLWEAIRGFQLAQTCAILIIIIAVVSLIDIVSQRLRKHFI